MKYTAAIKKKSDFSLVYKKGRYYAGKYFVLHILAAYPADDNLAAAGTNDNLAGTGSNYLGVVAGKKTGKSVRRNRLKRIIKENYRTIEEYIHTGFFYIFVVRARQGDKIPEYHDIRREMIYLMSKAGALNRQKWEISQNRV